MSAIFSHRDLNRKQGGEGKHKTEGRGGKTEKLLCSFSPQLYVQIESAKGSQADIWAAEPSE